jgi:hypothetical protein
MRSEDLEVLDRPLQVGDRALSAIRPDVRHTRTVTAVEGDRVVCDCLCGFTGEHLLRSGLERVA